MKISKSFKIYIIIFVFLISKIVLAMMIFQNIVIYEKPKHIKEQI